MTSTLDRIDPAERAEAPRLRLRRLLFLGLVTTTMLVLIALFLAALSPGGLTAGDWLLLPPFILLLPWSTIGFWNAAIGLWLLLRSAQPAGILLPGLTSRGAAGEAHISSSTALLVCIRNEALPPIEARLRAMLDDLQAHRETRQVSLYLLSDTDDPCTGLEEEKLVARLQEQYRGGVRLIYRRRDDNRDFKAGNIRAFCERFGSSHDFMIPLDADSLMSAEAVLRLVRIMQADERLGIVQHLTVGLPALSPFARIFQFGMRLGMRSYTLGAGWWQGECGPYWGHNAIIRIAPFMRHCAIAPIPGRGPLSGSVLSHDQLEAILMRRAGYETRVLLEEEGSYEANPTTLPEFIRRDLRWCQGNLQYLNLLGLGGASLVSRYQLVFAILMFVGSPAALIFAGLAATRLLLAEDPAGLVAPGPALVIVGLLALMQYAPKAATLFHLIGRAKRSAPFGGRLRLALGVVLEAAFMLLTLPIVTVSEALFIGGLLLRRRLGWDVQNRAEHRLGFWQAVRLFWPHTVIGLAGAGLFAAVSTVAFWWSLPITAGLILSIPIAILTSDPGLGRFMQARRLCAIPEDLAPPPEVVAIQHAASALV